jgi:hypothetical protein
MAADVPDIEPYEVYAGDTFRWNKKIDDYTPADGWALSYSFRSVTGTGFDISASANSSNDAWEITVAAATTANYTTGEYNWQAYVTKSGERYVVDNGVTQIYRNLNALSTSATTDLRTHAKLMISKIQSVLEGRMDADIENYSIGGRSINKIPVSELVDILHRYEEKLDKEERKRRLANKHGSGRLIKARFGYPTRVTQNSEYSIY